MAASAKAASLRATTPVSPSATRSATAPSGVTTQGRPIACASASARQKVSPGIAAVEHDARASEPLRQHGARQRSAQAHARLGQRGGAREHRRGAGGEARIAAIGRGAGVEVQLRRRHRGPDARRPKVQQPVQAAQRVGGEDRDRRAAERGAAPPCVEKGGATASGISTGRKGSQRGRLAGVARPERHQRAGAPPAAARGGAACAGNRRGCAATAPAGPVAAERRNSARQAVRQHQCRPAASGARRAVASPARAHLHRVAAPLERLGQQREGGFGAAERAVPDRPRRDERVLRPHHDAHQAAAAGGDGRCRSGSSRAFRWASRGNSPAQSEMSSPQPPSLQPRARRRSTCRSARRSGGGCRAGCRCRPLPSRSAALAEE